MSLLCKMPSQPANQAKDVAREEVHGGGTSTSWMNARLNFLCAFQRATETFISERGGVECRAPVSSSVIVSSRLKLSAEKLSSNERASSSTLADKSFLNPPTDNFPLVHRITMRTLGFPRQTNKTRLEQVWHRRRGSGCLLILNLNNCLRSPAVCCVARCTR